MKIHYKGIVHERFEDAPFVGMLIIAEDCKLNCKNCFNQRLKDLPTQVSDSKELIEEVRQNILNEGIILAGLEWSYQPKEAIELMKLAVEDGLEVMIYTGLDYIKFLKIFCEYRDFQDIFSQVYIKSGYYDVNRKCCKIVSGVKLASSNQEIHKGGLLL